MREGFKFHKYEWIDENVELNIEYKFTDSENKKGIFWILKGSKIRNNEAPSFKNGNPTFYKKFKELEQEKIIVDNIFKQDYMFNNLSEMGTICLKRISNGQELLKTL